MEIFKDKVEGPTLIMLSQTCWESHVKSVKTFKRVNFTNKRLLFDLAHVSKDYKTKNGVIYLTSYEFENFKFLLWMAI